MPPMRCSRPGVPGMAHGRASVRDRAGRARTRPSSWLVLGGERDRDLGQVGDLGEQPRLGAVGQVAVGQEHDRRHVPEWRSGPPRGRRRSSRPGDAARRPAPAHSPLRPNIAWSRSACSVFVGSPVMGPPRWMSMMTSGSSVMTARPIASDLRRCRGRWWRSRPAPRRRRRRWPRRRPAISSSAWKVRTPNACARQLVEDVGGGRDRVGAEEQRQPAPAGWPRPARRPGPRCR